MLFLLLVRKFQQVKTQRLKTHTHDMKEVAHRLIDTAQEIKKSDLKKITSSFYEISNDLRYILRCFDSIR